MVNTVKNGQYCQKQSKIKNGQKWSKQSKTFKNGLTVNNRAQKPSIWSKKRSKTVKKNGPKWSTIVKNCQHGQKQSKMVKNCQQRSIRSKTSKIIKNGQNSKKKRSTAVKQGQYVFKKTKKKKKVKTVKKNSQKCSKVVNNCQKLSMQSKTLN